MDNPSRRLAHTTRIPIRWGDVDMYGHVNNTVYFRLAEQARVEWVEDLGFPVGAIAPTGPVIVNTACTFYIPLNYPATAVVDTYVEAPGRSSVMTWFEIRVDGQAAVYAEGSAKIVWIDTQTGRSTPLPDALRATLPEG